MFLVLRPAQEYFTYIDVTVASEGLAKFRPLLGTQGL
jgi:hypothetical protein